MTLRRDLLPWPSEAKSLAEASVGKETPYCIWHSGDLMAYYGATDDDRAAWNRYVQREADAFDDDPHRDSYDSVRTATGVDRDGKVTNWCPPLYFPEWLEARNAPAAGPR